MLVLFIIGISGATGTYLLAHKGKQGVVRASALLSLIVAVIVYLLSDVLPLEYAAQIPVVFIGASFVGMTSPKIISSTTIIALSGAVFALLYIWATIFFNGMGGALGTAACIAVISTVALQQIVQFPLQKKRDE